MTTFFSALVPGLILGLVFYRLDRNKAPLFILAGLSSAVLLRGLYDFVLVASRLHIQWLASGIVTAAWLGVLRMKRTSQTG